MYDALRDSLPNITERQRQVIELIAAGCSNDEVGERLGISPRTAKAHSDVLRQKLGVTRRRQIPVAYRAITGDDPLARSLESAAADSGADGTVPATLRGCRHGSALSCGATSTSLNHDRVRVGKSAAQGESGERLRATRIDIAWQANH